MTLCARALTTASATAALLVAPVAVPGALSGASAAGDTTAPTGSFVILSATSTEDPGPMVVEVVQDSLRDDHTPKDDIVREVNWGTGVGYEPWRTGTSIEFAYTAIGRYSLRVRLTDKAGNTAVEPLGTVVVTDTFAPELRVNRPASDQLKVWHSLRGYARDVGLAGVEFVRVKAVQRRTRGWYAYLGEDRGWQLAPRGRAEARQMASAVRVPTSANGAWSASLKGVGFGRLVVRAFARDYEGNRSETKVVDRTLAR